MKGKITKWNDDKGFGFISIPEKENEVFFHISSIKTQQRRPVVGDLVDFELGKDSNGKVKAKIVSINGLAENGQHHSKLIKIEPPKKNILDLVLVIIFFGSLSHAGFKFYTSSNVDISWPFAVPAVIALVLLNRSKKPKQTHYSCATCKTVEPFKPRTIGAWNQGVTKFYCDKCHREWVKNNPKEQQSYSSIGKSRGCLGMVLLFAIFPVALVFLS